MSHSSEASSTAAHTDFPVSFQRAADSSRPARLGVQKGPSSWQKKPHIYSENGQSQCDFLVHAIGTVSKSKLLQALLALQQQLWERQQSHKALDTWAWRLTFESGWFQTIAGFHEQLRKRQKNRSSTISTQLPTAARREPGICCRMPGKDALSQPSPSSATTHSLPKLVSWHKRLKSQRPTLGCAQAWDQLLVTGRATEGKSWCAHFCCHFSGLSFLLQSTLFPPLLWGTSHL